jgi:hypothetical protein
MTTVSDLQAQLAALNNARASGIRSVEYAGRRTEYKSDVEMASAAADLARRIAGLTGASVVRGYYPIAQKGL